MRSNAFLPKSLVQKQHALAKLIKLFAAELCACIARVYQVHECSKPQDRAAASRASLHDTKACVITQNRSRDKRGPQVMPDMEGFMEDPETRWGTETVILKIHQRSRLHRKVPNIDTHIHPSTMPMCTCSELEYLSAV
jgi:hypothetical protein